MKQKIKIIILLLIILIPINIFINNNDKLYKTEIIKIIKKETISKKTITNEYNFKEEHKEVLITGKYQNTNKKNKLIKIIALETTSNIVTDKYKIGDKVFIKNKLILSKKQDINLSIILSITIVLLFLILGKQTLFLLLSLLLNIIIIIIGINQYNHKIPMLLILVFWIILFPIISLPLTNGINKKTISSIISTITSVLLVLLLLIILKIITNYHGINLNNLSYLTIPIDDILIPTLIIGSIGGVMDINILISTTTHEIIENNKNITKENLTNSLNKLVNNTTPAIINVMFFTYLSSALPLFILSFRNGFEIINYLKDNYTLEIARFLLAAIAILISIPISIKITKKLYEGKIK